MSAATPGLVRPSDSRSSSATLLGTVPWRLSWNLASGTAATRTLGFSLRLSVSQDVGRAAMELLAVADVIACGAGVLVSEPVLEVEDVDALLAGPGGGGDPERVDAHRGVEALGLHIPFYQI